VGRAQRSRVPQGLHSGCETIEPDGANAYRIAMAARIGPVAAKFKGRMQLADIDPPNGYTLSFEGRAARPALPRARPRWRSPGPERRRDDAVVYVTAQVGGKIAQIGSRLVDGAAQKLADDFFARFSDKVPRARRRSAAAAARRRSAPMPLRRQLGNTAWVRYVAIVILLAVVVYLRCAAGCECERSGGADDRRQRFVHDAELPWTASISRY
jgi:carbon monoxide dehydrogenase subunit G